MMDVLKLLYWNQGAFLQPQHFQLMDFANRQRVNLLQSYALKHFWGVGRLDINVAALANESFELRSGEFFFDDGAFVGIPSNAPSLTRSFAGKWPESEKPLDVYLALHRFNAWGANVTEVDGPEATQRATTRFVTDKDPEEVPDLHGDGPPAHIKRLTHALKIFFEPEREQMHDYHVIRIARLVREGDKIGLSGAFIPPCVSLDASEILAGLLQEVRDLVAVRCRVLEQYKSPNTMRRAEMDLRYMIYLLALMTLNRHLPVLNHVRTADKVHPWEMYRSLCQFLGELSTFSQTVNAAGEARDGTLILPAYDHQDLWGCFYAARKLCGELLEGIVLGPEYLITLERREESFVASPPEGVFKPDTAYWLILKTETPEAIRDPITQHVKLSASTKISTLIALAVPGAGLEFSENPPSGMPMDPKVKYYKIDRNCPQWLEIEKTRTISLYWPEAPEDLLAEIAVIRK
jgi:type VI secretion system protein ImpJ